MHSNKTMSETAISVQNLSKIYKLYDHHIDRLKEAVHPLKKQYHHKFYALKDIGFEVKKGEILGIVGRNGAGKSTLLKIITGVLTPSGGKCVVNGRISALLELGTGFNPDLTGLENIYFNGTIMGYSREEMDGKVDAILDFAEIGDFIKQPMKTYSSGMKARLGFAVAINIDPEILILDEVLSVGDDLFKRKCYAKMQQLFESGCTVLYVSHSVGSVNQICTRAIFLDDGGLILDGPTLLVTRYYHKFLYASPSSRREIKQEIITFNKQEKKKEEFERQGKVNENYQTGPELNSNGPEGTPPVKPNAYFIEGFEPKTTFEHNDYNIEISNARIETPQGKEVNALVMNETYVFSYKVYFDLELKDVRFSMLIQNEKGLSLAGVVLSKENNGEGLTVKDGDTYFVRSRFKCSMLPGTYYISVAVSSINEDMEKIPVSRINDIAVFKVQEEKDLASWGVLLLDHTGDIVKSEE